MIFIMPTLTIRHVTTYRYRRPVAFGEHRMMPIGAVGVSGAPGGDKDEACANAGLAKISERLN
jgi:hypothetical protein